MFDLFAVYDALDAYATFRANRIIIAWIDSPNPRQRFDALALIGTTLASRKLFLG